MKIAPVHQSRHCKANLPSVFFFLKCQKGAKIFFIMDLGKSYGMVARWYEEVVLHCGEFYCGKKVVRQDDDFLLKVVPCVTTSLATFTKKSCLVAATSLVEIAQKSPPRGITFLQMWQKKSLPRHTTSLQMCQNRSLPRVTTSLFFISYFFSQP